MSFLLQAWLIIINKTKTHNKLTEEKYESKHIL